MLIGERDVREGDGGLSPAPLRDRPPATGLEVIDYVLSLFEDESETALSSYFERAADAIEMALGAGMVSAMERFNRAEETADGPAD